MIGEAPLEGLDAATDLTPTRPTVVVQAVDAAEAAARASRVSVRMLDTLPDLTGVSELFGRIWQSEDSGLLPPNLLRAMAKAGSYFAGAFDGRTLVGACMGFFSQPQLGTLHSHIAGVDASMSGRNVGFALKLHQRAWALLHGVETIHWTFDPLVRRNAYFNIAKLGADPSEYLTNFYGPMYDVINGNDETDRLLLTWRLGSAHVGAACRGVPRAADAEEAIRQGATIGVRTSPTGGPVVDDVSDAPVVLVAVPKDVETLRRKDPVAAAEWRAAVREVFGGLLREGASVSGFDRAGWYIVERKDTK